MLRWLYGRRYIKLCLFEDKGNLGKCNLDQHDNPLLAAVVHLLSSKSLQPCVLQENNVRTRCVLQENIAHQRSDKIITYNSYDPGLTTPALKLDVYSIGFLTLMDFFRPKSNHCLALPLSHSVQLSLFAVNFCQSC